MTTTVKATGTVDAAGRLHLDVPTKLPPGRIDAIVTFDSVLAPENESQKYDFHDLTGKLRWQGDALSEQRRIRDEW